MGSKVAQFYGYSICLVAIIAVLVSVASVAGALTEWSDPLHTAELVGYSPRSLASLETYKMDVLNPPYGGPQANTPRYTPDDETLGRMYEAAKSDRIQSVRLQLRRSVVSNGLVMMLGGVLFGIHWRWLRRLSRA